MGDTLTQNLYVEGATDTQKNLIVASSTCGKEDKYCYLGCVNISDSFIVGKTENSFHMYVKGKNSTSYNKYVGQNILNYEDSIINLSFNRATKIPTNEKMSKIISADSFGRSISHMMNSAIGDVLTEQFYAFDIYYGINDGTIIGTVQEAYYIPHINLTNGELLNIGEETYLAITTKRTSSIYDISHTDTSNRFKIYVRIN